MLDAIRQLGRVEGRTDGVVEVEPARDDVESVEPVKRALSTCTCTGRMGLSERSNKRRARTCADDGDARTNLAGGKRMSCARGAMHNELTVSTTVGCAAAGVSSDGGYK